MDRAKYLQLIEPAIALVIKKGQDYNRTSVRVHDYFPFGHKSYVQMIFLKAMRLRSLVENDAAKPNFDSIEDTIYDLLNYVAFYLERLEATREVEARSGKT